MICVAAGAFGDDIDHPTGGTTAIENCAAAANDFNAVNGFDWYGGPAGSREFIFTHAAAIEKNQRVLIAGNPNPPRSTCMSGLPLLSRTKIPGWRASNRGSDVSPLAADLLAGNHRHADWLIARLFLEARSRYDDFFRDEIRIFLRVSACTGQQAGQQERTSESCSFTAPLVRKPSACASLRKGVPHGEAGEGFPTPDGRPTRNLRSRPWAGIRACASGVSPSHEPPMIRRTCTVAC